jgi:hypothetical protein
MKNSKNSTRSKSLIAIAKTIKGTTFASIPNYKSKGSGDINDYLILIGYSHENAMNFDFQQLQLLRNECFIYLSKFYAVSDIEIAYNELYSSLEKRLSPDYIKEQLRKENDKTIAQSDAQINAYNFLASGIKQHNTTKEIYVTGLEIRKRLIEKNPNPKAPTNSGTKTIIKNKIKYFCKFRENSIRLFIFEPNQINLKGISIK